MSGKQHILHSIAATAAQLGRTPSLVEFVALGGLSKHSVFRHFTKWNDAVRAAGLQPYRLYARPKDSELLEDWGEAVRKKGGLLSRRAYKLEGKYYPVTLEKRFGGWALLPSAFRDFAKGKPEWADVLRLLRPERSRKRYGRRNETATKEIAPNIAQHTALKDRSTYGNPIHFRGLRHEPVNEQGVVLLFGMLARDLGYVIEAVQKGFPDCEAKRQIAPDLWQRVNIEFEYESKNFRNHEHPAAGCDVIVCWRHNWAESPENIEVVELSSIVKSLR
jgi:hypothetical protein